MFSESSLTYKIASRFWHKAPPRLRQSLWKFVKRGAYQKLEFRGKTFVNGTDRSKSYRQLFPTPPIGKSILDVGSNLGYYSLMALQEGAKYCRAIEKDEWCVNKIAQVAADLGLENLHVVQSDIFDYPINEDFDIVLCLNLVHHFGTIERVAQVLDTLYQHAREQMILIVLTPADRNKLYIIDKEPDPMGNARFIRISPRYFVAKYSPAQVQVTEAITYGPGRYTIVITKPKADQTQANLN